ncbi:hypothetical protein LRAMOSA08312 [Lichtheimia ramosa]|uniref:Uncharacterized protein n=1 Tax=Lichtheimia ramosa TaxID=688394 RepID=A0A077WF68_9FUNG|nr:hypothetical protein LRAMOSA08312 [Lichtheimia ramosa]
MSSLQEATTQYQNDQQHNEQHQSGICFTNHQHISNKEDNTSIEWVDDQNPYAFYEQIIEDQEMYDFEENQVQQQQHQAEYDYQQDALLHLVVGVQSYLADLSCSGLSNDQQASPLNDLQYKMYTYLKRRAHDMGVMNVADSHPISNS